MGWNTEEWNGALDQYVEAVGDYLDKLESERDEIEDPPSPERTIQRAAGPMFRIIYARNPETPRPFPVVTSGMLDAVARLGETFALSFAEVSPSSVDYIEFHLPYPSTDRSLARCTRELRRPCHQQHEDQTWRR